MPTGTNRATLFSNDLSRKLGEAELRRGNLESNVAKTWEWLEAHPTESPIVLISAFPTYDR